MRKVIEKDIVVVDGLIEQLFPGEKRMGMERLGGMTNHTYRVIVTSGEYIFRIPGEGTEELIDRKNEIISNRLASQQGIDERLVYCNEHGIKVMPYIKHAVTMDPKSLRLEENILLVANVLKKLHTCKVDTGVAFDVFGIAKQYEDFIVKNHGEFYEDHDECHHKVHAILHELQVKKEDYVPCHNDPLCENWVKSDDRMFLVDWEYAGMNDPLWDLADVSIEAHYNREQDSLLLKTYFDDVVSEESEKRFLANKIYLDYLWSLWGKTRVPFEPTMETYAYDRYIRLKENLQTWDHLYGDRKNG